MCNLDSKPTERSTCKCAREYNVQYVYADKVVACNDEQALEIAVARMIKEPNGNWTITEKTNAQTEA